MTDASTTLHELVVKFKQWLTDTHTREQIDQLNIDDAGYPGWSEISDCFAGLLVENQIAGLTKEAQVDLLYLVARNWDIGFMIAWLSSGDQLSNVGVLRPNEFILLAETVSSLNQAEFNDAKFQFAVCCKKLKVLTPEVQSVLLSFCRDPHEYTRICALKSLAMLNYPGIKPLVYELWESVNDEHSKIACLDILDAQIQDRELIAHYLTLAAAIQGEYLAAYVSELRQKLSIS